MHSQLAMESRVYPLPPAEWPPLLEFWQTEWAHTDVDWLEALRGAYADSLTIQLVRGTLDGRIAGTASVCHARTAPEVCCLADVLTAKDCRGMGIGARLSEEAVRLGFAAGCRVAFLGNKPTPGSVYHKIGFTRLRGAVMDAVVHDAYEGQLAALARRLLKEARARKLTAVEAYLARSDAAKAQRFREAGFHSVATLPQPLRVGAQCVEVELLEARP